MEPSTIPAATSSRTPRDVLADRIEQWAGDWHVYDYADRLLADLDAAGYQILGNGTEGDEHTADDYHDPEGEPGLEAWIKAALAEYREYDAIHRGTNLLTGKAREVRFYTPGNIVNALAARTALVGPADTKGHARAVLVLPAAPSSPGQADR